MQFLVKIMIGLFASTIISYIAYKKQALTLSGAIGAMILGTGIFFGSGLYGSFLIFVFFSTSTIFTFIKRNYKNEIEKQYEKSGGRDFYQVFANGGVGLLYSLLYSFTFNPMYLILIGVSFAASNADTWASELGVFSKSLPVSLRSFKKVPKGTSGAVSLFGILMSFLGSLLIAFSAIIIITIFQLNLNPFSYIEAFLLIILGGILGSMIDSILGATIQAVYYNENLKKETEKAFEEGKSNVLIRGYKLINNDFVNFTSILLATIIILLLCR
ncbi:DUF92 domain-containing protein [Defluviitalea raffinosedens]|uniref:DUF92 domain-containing protein n=1 Tax=Defluviitalea raffinosedens TaxID=1450156 RepID=A0A7C8LIY9_9FIRM|nr:DUF92 domain-containing protein [Defluviitalea raffinosedens]KAE9637140.1 DUF92 domain-containing protein [Defluviitalea raffinosedens]MBM7686558.1 uncharacterized protein (TIGR00297 family) [Defluviitalea raffinosedens]HHW66835.1 DUF92 domain-containing protein [Candidatus Epulonipiscium sp.]